MTALTTQLPISPNGLPWKPNSKKADAANFTTPSFFSLVKYQLRLEAVIIGKTTPTIFISKISSVANGDAPTWSHLCSPFGPTVYLLVVDHAIISDRQVFVILVFES
ncbi:putative cytochrome c oxidase polypeptide I [Trichinella spiralis]|uniref:putative cytochrome c oxidase polypeptide I n=1 Tax=Trichinella spiralis TaxID=6334 RepID=UPI0001EFCCB3|nr:putative cytochrome c oxidase polypeptide I [Trichinella spiralis]